jgi:hypothetical protein
MTYAQNELELVSRRYDPENDLIPGAPKVTHTDYVIIEALKESIAHIATLLKRIEALEDQAHTHENPGV